MVGSDPQTRRWGSDSRNFEERETALKPDFTQRRAAPKTSNPHHWNFVRASTYSRIPPSEGKTFSEFLAAVAVGRPFSLKQGHDSRNLGSMGRPWRAPVPPIQFEEASAWHEGKIVGIPGDGGGRENSREFADWPQERAVGMAFD